MVMSVKGYIDNESIATLPIGIYTSSDSSSVTGMPAIGNHAAIVIRTAYGQNGLIATAVIDIEGNLGVYTRRYDGLDWIKQ